MPIATTTTNHSAGSFDAFAQKAAQFQAHAEELKRKEEAYQKSKSPIHLEAGLAPVNNEKAPNWPFIYPLLRHELADLEGKSSEIINLNKQSYNMWRLFSFLLFLNTILVSVYFWVGLSSTFVVVYANLAAFFFPLLSFFTAHYPLYRGSLEQKKLFLGISVAGNAIEVLILGLMLLGVVEGAAGGVFQLLNLLRFRRWILFASATILQLAFLILLALKLNILRRVIKHVRSEEIESELQQHAYNQLRQDGLNSIRTLAKDILK